LPTLHTQLHHHSEKYISKMCANSGVALILGAGPRIGRSVADAFAAKGYQVAIAARSLKDTDSTKEELHIQADFADTSAMHKIFAKVQEVFGSPNVIVFNGSSSPVSLSAICSFELICFCVFAFWCL
jgi:NAD(P)-dependent dehydrogenase (short-subunit alcohol dehydrogenase family)